MKRPHQPARRNLHRRACVVGALVVLCSMVGIRGDDPSQRQVLDQYVQMLQSGVASTELELRNLEGDISRLQQEIEELIQQVETAADPGETPATRPVREEPTEVSFRPPLARAGGDLNQTVLVWCESNRVSVVDVDAVVETADRNFSELGAKLMNGEEVPLSGRWSPSRGDFDCLYEVLEDRSGAQVWLERKPNAPEDPAGAMSQFREAIRAKDPRDTLIYFVVFSDSFDLYQPLSADAVESGYEIFWLPQPHEARLFPGAGDQVILR